MIGRSSSFLGVAVSDRSVACAEISVAGERRSVRRTATFVFPEGVSLDQNPESAGQALAAFLRQKRFGASRVVVGVPARWLIAVEKELPPADESQARATLRLQAERLAVAEHDELVFDFAGAANPRESTKILLVGMLRQRLDRVERMMDAAGMSVVAVTSSGLALSAAAVKKDQTAGVLLLDRGGGEMVWRQRGTPRMLRHVPLSMNGYDLPSLVPLSAELHRAVTLTTTNGELTNRELLLLDGIGLHADQVSQLSDRLGVSIRSDDVLSALRMQSEAGAITEADSSGRPLAGFAPALSLALAGAKPQTLPLNFRHSRLATPQAARISRRTVWGIALGAVALIGIVALLLTVRNRESTLDELTAHASKLKPDVTAAQLTIDRLNYGRGFFEKNRPPVLECLRELTAGFRDDERIWATTFNIKENGRGNVAGKSADRDTVLKVIDRLQKNPHFVDVRMQDLREADQRTHEVAFSVNFTYANVE